MTAMSWTRGLNFLASLRLTVGCLLLLGVGVLLAYFGTTSWDWPLVVPLALLSLNLGAAIAANRVFRRQTSLLVFHLALLMLIALAAVGRLTYLKARVEVAEGSAFDGVPVEVKSGPLHQSHLDRLGFVNERLVIDYTPLVTIAQTRNWVRWRDGAGHWHEQLIGEQEPAVLDGYRFYTTAGKGFAAVLSWTSAKGEDYGTGTVHFPKYPTDLHNQTVEWQLPGTSRPVWMQLVLEGPVLAEGKPSQLRAPQPNRIVIRDQEIRGELRPGSSMVFPEGTLSYRELRLWMGYLVYYDPTVPWILAAALVACLSLAWHFVAKFVRTPW